MIAVRMIHAFLLAMMALLIPQAALADDNRPLVVSAEQESASSFRMTWKLPVNVEARHMPALSADGCEQAGRARNWTDPLGIWREESWTCPEGLVGRQVAITYPTINPALATIVRFRPMDGTPQTVLLQPQETGFALPSAEEASGTFLDFIVLGVEHIWIGIDHLLFVAGLIFIARTPRRILTTITGFTIAHSVTLVLSTLDIVRLPIAAIETVIALSIVFLAVEIVKGPRDTLTWRRPIFVASAFGLLHGFGFAAVLREIDLPEDGFFSALLAFNIGIELGQVAFAGAVIALLWLMRHLGTRLGRSMNAAKLAGYGVGILASAWMYERMLA